MLWTNSGYYAVGRPSPVDQRTIWTIYDKACEKLGTRFYSFPKKSVSIPISALCDRKFSTMEAAVLYLRKQGLKNKEIAEAIDRSDRTISSIFVRLKKRGDLS